MVDFARLRDGPPPAPRLPGVVLGITGHRPDKLWSARDALSHDGYDRENPVRAAAREWIRWRTEESAKLPAERGRMGDAHLEAHMARVRWASGWEERWREAPIIGVSGVAQGADWDAAGEWVRMGVPFVAAVPFVGQERMWPAEAQERYARVLARAAGVVVVAGESWRPNDRGSAARALGQRNDWIVAASDRMLAVWDGSSGGTANCVRSARRVSVPIQVWDPAESRGTSCKETT